MSRLRNALLFTLLIALLTSLITISGCSKPAEPEPAAPQSGSQTDTNEQGSGEDEAVKVLALGKKGSNKVVSEVAATKVTAVTSLTSPEATKLLQVGAPGESPEVEKQPEAGNEFLMVTFSYKAKKKLVGIHPADVKLEDSEGKQYDEVSTSGHGGVYNQDPPQADEAATVTAVYEVPTGAKGLTLTYQPFGDKVLTFKIR